MPVQIANPAVVAKIERLATATGLNKTAAVEAAVDALLAARAIGGGQDSMARLTAILAQLDQIPDQPAAPEAIEWDQHGLAG